MIDPHSTKVKNVSEIFLRFVAQLYESTPKDVAPEYLQRALSVPMMIWNAVVVRKWGRPHNFVDDVIAELEKAAAPDKAIMTEMLHMWVRRKEATFPGELWAIRDLVVYRDFNGELTVRVVAAAPEEFRHQLPVPREGTTSPTHPPH